MHKQAAQMKIAFATRPQTYYFGSQISHLQPTMVSTTGTSDTTRQRLLVDQVKLAVILERLARQVAERHVPFEDSVIIGLQPRGLNVAQAIQQRIATLFGHELPLGYLDITFYRDDFRRRDTPLQANRTQIDFVVEGARVILVDDVLFTGRSVRAAMDAMTAYGRPKQVELLTLVDRKLTRELPIQPDYIGLQVDSILSQRVRVDWEQDPLRGQIWMLSA